MSIPTSIVFDYSYEVILNDLSLEHVPTKNKGRPRPTGKAKTRKVSAIPGKQQSSLIISVTTNKRHYLDPGFILSNCCNARKISLNAIGLSHPG